MKRLFIIVVVTVALWLVAYAFVWTQNRQLGEEISDLPTLMPNTKSTDVVTGDNTTSWDVATWDALSGAMLSGATASGSAVVEDASGSVTAEDAPTTGLPVQVN